MAACPRLTELTVILPYPHGAEITDTGILLDPIGVARSAISELVIACKALPDFDTFQIVRYPIGPPPLVCRCTNWWECSAHTPSSEQWEEALEKQMKDLEEWAIDCLKEPRIECQEEGRKRTTLRAIKFAPGRGPARVETKSVM